jgi:hypothetical protein
MATTIPAIMAIIQADTSVATQDGGSAVNNPAVPIQTGIGRRGISAWDHLPPSVIQPLTAAQRTAAITALLGGTVANLSDVLALIATAAVTPVTQAQIWRLITNGNDATVG